MARGNDRVISGLGLVYWERFNLMQTYRFLFLG